MSDQQFQYLVEKLFSEYGMIFLGVIMLIVVVGIFGVRIVDRVIKIVQMRKNGTKKVSIEVPHDGSANGKRVLDNIETAIGEWGKGQIQDRKDAKEFRTKIWGVVNKITADLAEEKLKNAVQTVQLENLEKAVSK